MNSQLLIPERNVESPEIKGVIDRFYKQLSNFVERIITVLQSLKVQKITDSDGVLINVDDLIISLRKNHDKVNLAQKVDRHQPVIMFYEGVVAPYANEIVLRDEAYFHDTIGEREPNERQLILIFSRANREVKKNLWDHINLLCVTAEKILGGNIFETARKCPHRRDASEGGFASNDPINLAQTHEQYFSYMARN